jgi:hypothetical protein
VEETFTLPACLPRLSLSILNHKGTVPAETGVRFAVAVIAGVNANGSRGMSELTCESELGEGTMLLPPLHYWM